MEGQVKDLNGTIETLERQLVQSGIKNKVMQASVEINKKKEEVKNLEHKEVLKTQAQEKLIRDSRNLHAGYKTKEINDVIKNEIKMLRTKEKKS